MPKFPNISKIQGVSHSEGMTAGGGRVRHLCSPVLLTTHPHVMGCRLHWAFSLSIKVCSPHHLSESPHQCVSPSDPIVCRGVTCTKSVLCPLPSKFYVILYKIIGKLPLSTCFTNLIVGTPFLKVIFMFFSLTVFHN